MEEKGITVASPRHDEEGCAIPVFVLCEFARMLEQVARHYCLAELQSCMFMTERRREEERISQQ